ncbi:hypothetical protein Xcc3_01770 [Xanthomonas campestris pv. campestris]|nr:hypothetical protein Xcc3_01770 [Xanthomonas campestris pv. campestris]
MRTGAGVIKRADPVGLSGNMEIPLCHRDDSCLRCAESKRSGRPAVPCPTSWRGEPVGQGWGAAFAQTCTTRRVHIAAANAHGTAASSARASHCAADLRAANKT